MTGRDPPRTGGGRTDEGIRPDGGSGPDDDERDDGGRDDGSEYDGGRRDGERDDGYGTVPVLVSAAVALVVTALAYWWATGFAVFFENLFRVQPTVEGRGVGADWVASNTNPLLDFLIALTHAADVIMGLFILVMVFLHWASFRRLAGRMQRGDREGASEVAADGGGEDDRR